MYVRKYIRYISPFNSCGPPLLYGLRQQSSLQMKTTTDYSSYPVSFDVYIGKGVAIQTVTLATEAYSGELIGGELVEAGNRDIAAGQMPSHEPHSITTVPDFSSSCFYTQHHKELF